MTTTGACSRVRLMCGGGGAVQGGAGGGGGGERAISLWLRVHLCFISQLRLLIKCTALPTLRPDMKESFFVGDAVSFHEWRTVLRAAFYSG